MCLRQKLGFALRISAHYFEIHKLDSISSPETQTKASEPSTNGMQAGTTPGSLTELPPAPVLPQSASAPTTAKTTIVVVAASAATAAVSAGGLEVPADSVGAVPNAVAAEKTTEVVSGAADSEINATAVSDKAAGVAATATLTA